MSDTKKKADKKKQATVGETLGFAWKCGPKVKLMFFLGTLAGIANGSVYPILAYLFSTSFSDIGAAASQGLAQIRELAYTFMVVGSFALVAATIQTGCFEAVAYHGSSSFRLQWFRALLRQDLSYFDVYDIGGIAVQVGPSSNRYRRGVGRKFGEGIQFSVTTIGGIGYAFYASWHVAFVILSLIPFITAAAVSVMVLNQNKSSRTAKSYKKAGSVAYTSVSSIKTVLSLNVIKEMARQYEIATEGAFREAVVIHIKQGFANGSMLASCLLFYAVLTLYGSALLYRDIVNTGCDPSDAVISNTTCNHSGPDVYGSMLGIACAAHGLSQFGNFLEAFSIARVAAYDALSVINREPGSNEVIIYDNEYDDTLGETTRSKEYACYSDVEEGEANLIKSVLPKYAIDSLSTEGAKPGNITGAISVKNVHFTYPTRPKNKILNGMTVDIVAGQTVAFVGPSGGGKSTIVALLERFYDPTSGKIELDGIDLRDLNVKYLRSHIGYVGQEPILFATTIHDNIKYGNQNASDRQIIEAAKMANAHDFISSFTDGYNTQVGDKGSQLSGGQKQRIAIARVLVGDPKILLLDEATSALDAESELIVQDALDTILEAKKITTIIIAHRLSTIRKADVINVIVGGEVVESGTHDHLMTSPTYYRKLVEKQEGKEEEDADTTPTSSRANSTTDLKKLEENAETIDGVPTARATHIEFKNVSFSYPTRPKKRIFENFNLKIYQGQTVALVGPSGGGKSTAVELIERFYDPTEGCIEYLGTDVKGLNVAWYRDQIGYVGQEPVLFNDTIARNIVYGCPGATQKEIEEAAVQANAYDFISKFAQGFNTPVGETGTRLSGGQKQRIAIARALVKKPKVLILDEATSALDNESESIVQAAIDKLIQSRDQTVILIAHRLSTVRNADHIAMIVNGKVVEYGSHNVLIAKKLGHYRHLFASSRRSTTIKKTTFLNSSIDADAREPEEECDWEDKIAEEENKAFDASRARGLLKPYAFYILIGCIGSVLAGGIFPLWGVLFSETINILFRPVFACPDENGAVPIDITNQTFSTCKEYWSFVAEELQNDSFRIAGYWAAVMINCLLSNVMTYWGFGQAAERLNKKLRNTSFITLLRQEPAYFDMRSVGKITSELQDDNARIHAFAGDPIRSLIIALSAVVTGIVLSFIFMWPFALLAIGCVPLMGFATLLEIKQTLGEDQGDAEAVDNFNTPSGVLVETLLNMRTISALTLEDTRYRDYQIALLKAEANYKIAAITGGCASGLSMFIQQWINALQLWFGGFMLFTFPEKYDLRSFLIANFAVSFALFGLGPAFQDMADRKEVQNSAGRIFHLLDRTSAIDPLSVQGKKLD